MKKNKRFAVKNLEIREKSCIFARNLRGIYMAGRRIKMSAAFERYSGDLDGDFYIRTLVKDKSKVMAVCRKPRYTKDQRKKMAKRPQIKRFNSVIQEAQKIYHDPILRAEWEARHQAFMAEAKKRGDYTFPRLWDYLRHELNIAKMQSQEKGQ